MSLSRTTDSALAVRIKPIQVNAAQRLKTQLKFELPIPDIVKCCTTEGDTAYYKFLRQHQTNADWAFCGSGLYGYFVELRGRELKFTNPRADSQRILQYLESARETIWPRGDKLNRRKIIDIFQAILFKVYMLHEIDKAYDVHKQNVVVNDIHGEPDEAELEVFRESIEYTTWLQELTQGIDREKPVYKYTLLTPMSEWHNPIYRCVAQYHNFIGVGEASSKKQAKRRAAFELLRRIRGS